MNGRKACDDHSHSCYFHPKEVVLGVCSLCLKERLTLLALKQEKDRQRIKLKKSHRKLPKISWICDHTHDHDLETASKIHEEVLDSFISIKFGDNGVATWEKGTAVGSKASELDKKCAMPWINGDDGHHILTKDHSTKAVIEHPKPVRWRNWIGQILRLLKPSTVCHVGARGKSVKVKTWISNNQSRTRYK